jgi:hypothetical protein
MTVVFKVGDRVRMQYGRGWHGSIVDVPLSHSSLVTVQWDNGRVQTFNAYIMGLVPEAS